MAWEQVEAGTTGDGERYAVERQVLYLPIPGPVPHLIIRRDRYRSVTHRQDGTINISGVATSRDDARDAVRLQAQAET